MPQLSIGSPFAAAWRAQIFEDHAIGSRTACARRVAALDQGGDGAFERAQLTQLAPHHIQLLLGQITRIHA